MCHFGLSDIDDLGGALTTIARALVVGGVFVFSILHPCFPGAGADAPSSWPSASGYYSEGWWLADNPGFRGKVGANHRMLSTYLNRLGEHGLQGERFVEPQPSDGWTASSGASSLPVFFVARARKRDARHF